MALPVIIAMNQTGSPILIEDLGITIPASPGQLTLTEGLFIHEITNSPDLHVEVDAGTLLLNVNTVNLTQMQGVAYVTPSAPDVELMHNLTATTNPTAGDDDEAGYSAGSLWLNTTDQSFFILVDASTGAASWLGGGPRTFPSSATDPVSPIPVTGDQYYNTTLEMNMRYDGSRGKFLSSESVTIQLGRNGNVGADGTYLRAINGMVTGAALGYDALYNGTIVGWSIRRSTLSVATYAVTASGADIATQSFALNDLGVRQTNSDGDFSTADVLAVRLVTDGVAPESDVQILVRFKWRV